MGIQYDNSAFYYFTGVMLQFYLLPATYYNITSLWDFLKARAHIGESLGEGRTAAEKKKFERIREERKKCGNLFTSCFTVQFVILFALWGLFSFIMILAAADSEIMTFDPYKILGVETGADVRSIKKAYRKQSLIWHPDKNPNNQGAEEKFMVIAKAYEALTDPEARENWEKYGNPDGKQSMEVSIGLPSLLMDSGNHTMVMIVYLLILVIVIPTGVWKYYSWSRAYMDAVLTETYSVFGDLKLYHPNTSIKNIPEILCMAAEYRDLSDFLKTKETGDALMKLEKTLKANGMLPKPMFRSFEGKRIEKFFNHFRGNKLAFLVLYAHLHRVEITNANLEKAQQKVLKKMPLLIESLANIGEERTKACGANPRFIAMAAQWLMTVHNVLVFSQCLTQAVWYSSNDSSKSRKIEANKLQSSLLQLPHFTSREINENKRSKTGAFRREEEMRNYLRGDKLERDGESFKRGQKDFNQQQKDDITSVEKLLPDLELDVHYGVDGEDQVVAEDLITVDFQMSRHGIPLPKGGDEAEKAQPVHSAHYPFAKEEKWWAYLLYHLPQDPKKPKTKTGINSQRLLMTQVITAQDRLDSEPIYAEIIELLSELKIVKEKESKEDEEKLIQEEDIKKKKQEEALAKGEEYDSDDDTDDEEEEEEDRLFERSESTIIEDKIVALRKSLPTRFKFRGPDAAGTYTFTVIVKSDSYMGLDHSKTVNIEIAGKEVLPEFKLHKKDVGLDKEPTMFDLMHGLDQMEDENDDFNDDDSDDEDGDNEPAKMIKGSKIVPDKTKEEKKEEKKDEEEFVILD